MFVGLFARRYLFSPSSRSVINIISGVSLVAVSVPVAAMIILLSVFNGFEGLVRQTWSVFDADLTIRPTRGSTFDIAEVERMGLAECEEVAAYSFAIEQEALVTYRDNRVTVNVRGVDERYADVVPAAQTITSGSYCVQLGEDVDKVVVGQGVAYALGLRSFVTEDLRIYAVRRNSFSTLLPVDGYSLAELPVAGIFMVDAETDGENVLISLRKAQQLFDYEGAATSLFVKLSDGSSPEKGKMVLAEMLGEGFEIRSRDELNATLNRLMKYEKWGIFFIALMVLIIASFSIVGALVMLIIDKERDIATLRAMGADTSLLRKIFTAEGVLICTIGGVVGLMFGMALTLVQQHIGIIRMPTDGFLVDVYPVELHFGDVVTVVMAFAMVVLLISATTVRTMISEKRS
ncbi:MAG: ABC transporter permease [Alistipes sp.]|nr:ABC transporter permease [Alistipes sp.]